MKNLTLLILLLPVFIWSQHPDFQTNTWYVKSTTINNTTTQMPDDPVVFPYISLKCYPNTSLFGTQNPNYQTDCYSGLTGNVNYNGTTEFTFINANFFGDLSGCATAHQDFMNAYLDLFNNTITDAFTYTIADENNGTKTLTITNSNNDTITYTNSFYTPAPVEISDKTWYLHYLTINGDTVYPPNNWEYDIEGPQLHFDSNTNESIISSGGVCPFMTNYHVFDSTQSQDLFYLYDGATTYGIEWCALEENNIFTAQYLSDIFLSKLPGPFSFQYSSTGSSESLTITNPDGNIAVYGTMALSAGKFDRETITVYPNPVADIISLTLSDDLVLKDIAFFDIQGKKTVQMSNYNGAIDISGFASGLFFLKITTNKGVFIKKIVKK